MNVHSIKAATNRTVRGRPRVDDKRRLILDAALRVFAERGYHGTAVPEVAQTAKVSTGTLYHYFESKELLVNEVYRDAKTRLRATLLHELPRLDPYQLDQGRAWFTALWNRLGAFAQAEPDAFRFLEMQDHTPYLDNESKQLELSVLAPLWLEGKRLTDRAAGAGDAPPVDVAIALLWGAFVGLIKASRLGYLTLDERSLARAGAACWRMIAPQLPRAATESAAKTNAGEAVRSASTRIAERSSRSRTKVPRSPRTRKG
jgi:AcrR family transcriptional regulator